MKRQYYLSFLFIIFLPYSTVASDVSLEKDLQRSLEQSSALINHAIAKLKSGDPITNEITRLKAVSENLRALHLLLDNKFRTREEEVKASGTKALERQRSMSEGYRNALDKYLSLIDSLPPGEKISQTQLETLAVFLEKVSQFQSLSPFLFRPVIFMGMESRAAFALTGRMETSVMPYLSAIIWRMFCRASRKNARRVS